MQTNQSDQSLAFKKRARRRLVGAIALVLLMIVILPMILEDREQVAVEEEITIVMPDEQVQDEVANDTEIIVDEPVKETVLAEDTEVAAPKEAEPVEVQKPDPVETKPEPKKAPEPVQAKPAQTKPNKTSDQYYVQIGVFSNPSNVKKLQAKLKELGYQSLTEQMTTDTGVKTRLRTETFVGRNEAAIALENIKDAGLTGMVVNQK